MRVFLLYSSSQKAKAKAQVRPRCTPAAAGIESKMVQKPCAVDPSQLVFTFWWQWRAERNFLEWLPEKWRIDVPIGCLEGIPECSKLALLNSSRWRLVQMTLANTFFLGFFKSTFLDFWGGIWLQICPFCLVFIIVIRSHPKPHSVAYCTVYSYLLMKRSGFFFSKRHGYEFQRIVKSVLRKLLKVKLKLWKTWCGKRKKYTIWKIKLWSEIGKSMKCAVIGDGLHRFFLQPGRALGTIHSERLMKRFLYPYLSKMSKSDVKHRPCEDCRRVVWGFFFFFLYKIPVRTVKADFKTRMWKQEVTKDVFYAGLAQDPPVPLYSVCFPHSV